ncbi:MAG: helix-turn-helix transcriptional regulator [Bryobacteraceae bacterium]
MIDELRSSREYREAYAESFLNQVLTAQIRVIREQRGFKQKELAAKVGKHQPGWSRIEDSGYGKWNVSTLREVAAALDTWLRVSLEPYGKLVDEALSLSPDALKQPSFDEDPAFLRPPRAVDLLREEQDSGPVGELRRQLLPWLEESKWRPEPLIDWLQGRNLISFGHEDEPYRWFLRALPAGDAKWSWHRLELARRLAKILEDQPDVQKPGRRPSELLSSLFLLAAGLDCPDLLADPLYAVYGRLRRGTAELDDVVRDCLLAALTRNQKDLRLYEVWLRMMETGKHDVLPGNEYAGFEGVTWLPPRPDFRDTLEEVAYAIKLLEQLWWKTEGYDEAVERLRRTLLDFRQRYSKQQDLAGMLLDAASRTGWTQAALYAWHVAFSSGTDDLLAVLDFSEFRFRATNLTGMLECDLRAAPDAQESERIERQHAGILTAGQICVVQAGV